MLAHVADYPVVRALAEGPTKVHACRGARRQVVDLLPARLADVSDPEVARELVEGEAPGVAQAVGPDLPTAAGLAGEGIVGRDRVRRAAHVEAQELPRQLRQVLRAAVVALRGVQHAVGSERQHAAVVDRLVARDLEQLQLAARIRLARIPAAREEANELHARAAALAVATRCDVVDVEAAVGRVRRVEHESEQSLRVLRHDRRRQVEEHRSRSRSTDRPARSGCGRSSRPRTAGPSRPAARRAAAAGRATTFG